MTCKCFARCEADCVCDHDWTPPAVIALREEVERLRAELAEAKRDVDRINWMEKNKVGIYAAQSSVRATTGPRYFKPWKFCGWSAANRDDELPTVREAIDAAMAGGA